MDVNININDKIPPIKVVYDKPHTKQFMVDGKLYEVLYNWNYCKDINFDNLNFIEDGYYTYIIHDNYELIISKVCPFEDGSKHIQLLSKTKNAYTAGEFHKNGTSFIVNMFAGLFRLHNPFIMRHNKNFVLWLIQVTFNKHGALNITITVSQLIYANHFFKTGIWDVSILNQIGYKK